MGFDFANILQQYLGGTPNPPLEQAHQDFDQVAQAAPHQTIAQGVSEALRSDQTPPFPQMISQLFQNSDSGQRTSMLRRLIGSISPAMLSSVAGGVLGHLFQGKPDVAQVTPEIAAQLTPQQVQEIAASAEQNNPSVIDRMGDFYAEHPTLVKTLGGVALAIMLGKMAEARQH
ncbi:MAG: hypothetical protein V4724_25375 [Pseudomonadota bacterium]